MINGRSILDESKSLRSPPWGRSASLLEVRRIMRRHHRVVIAVGDACGSTDVRQSNGANVDYEVVKDSWNLLYLSPLRLLCLPPICSRSRS
jgi:hypothetical protein